MVPTIANPRHSLRPSRWRAGKSDPSRLEELARALSSEGAGEGEPRLRYEQPLGEGGMALVWLATQATLGRKVAVKTLRAENCDERAADALLQEARITGFLEHPNVIPVHDLGRTSDGRPYIVLKHIEGVIWSDLLRDAGAVARSFGADDLLEWNLQVFQHVCNAVHFAHKRGIIHRDLKPSNVMIGELGEVYVLDWGIAVSADANDERFPRASDVDEVAGTPCYMAPEMLRADGAAISIRSDVYLLGAILYEILTGHGPREGADFTSIETAAGAAHPALPRDCPAELVLIVEAALATEPADRPASALEVRRAVGAFLEHRGSSLIAAEASVKLDLLLEELAAAERAPAERRQRAYHLYGECRFGFRHALRTWPENDAAKRGQLRAAAAMVALELAAGNPAAARGLLADLAEPAPALVERIEAAEEAERARTEALGRLRDDLDPGVAQVTRMRVTVPVGILWTVGPLFGEWLERWPTGEPSHVVPLLAVATTNLLALGIWFFARSLQETALNRWGTRSMIVTTACQVLVRLGAMWAGLDPRQATLFDFVIWFCVLALQSVILDRRLLLPALGYLGAFLVSARAPEYLYYAMAAANCALTVTVAILWGRPRPDSKPIM